MNIPNTYQPGNIIEPLAKIKRNLFTTLWRVHWYEFAIDKQWFTAVDDECPTEVLGSKMESLQRWSPKDLVIHLTARKRASQEQDESGRVFLKYLQTNVKPRKCNRCMPQSDKDVCAPISQSSAMRLLSDTDVDQFDVRFLAKT